MNAASYTTQTYVIPAGGFLSVPRAAEFITCLAASAEFQVRFDDQPKSDFEAGLTFNHSFQKVTISNEDGAHALTVKLGFGKGQIQDSRQTIEGEITSVSKTPDLMQEQAPVTVNNAANAQLLPANPNRKEAIIVNEGLGKVYVSTNPAAAAGQGVPLDGGQALTLEQTAALHVRNDSGAAVNVSATDNGWTP